MRGTSVPCTYLYFLNISYFERVINNKESEIGRGHCGSFLGGRGIGAAGRNGSQRGCVGRRAGGTLVLNADGNGMKWEVPRRG